MADLATGLNRTAKLGSKRKLPANLAYKRYGVNELMNANLPIASAGQHCCGFGKVKRVERMSDIKEIKVYVVTDGQNLPLVQRTMLNSLLDLNGKLIARYRIQLECYFINASFWQTADTTAPVRLWNLQHIACHN